jgi:hypothetical protein
MGDAIPGMAGAWEAQCALSLPSWHLRFNLFPFRFFCDLIVFVFTVVRSYRQPFKIPGSILSYMVRDGEFMVSLVDLIQLS